MRKRILTLVAIAGVFITILSYAQQNEPTVANMPPVVVKTVPQSGDTEVDPGLTEIRVTFSKDMLYGNWSCSTMSQDSFPEMVGKPRYEDDKRTCVIDVKLEPGKTYGTWLNSQRYGNFKDTGKRSAVPYLLIFKTKSE
ncbi:MAG: Ig-like domain-containing protein [Candidatus Hydrogenedentota bacterium]